MNKRASRRFFRTPRWVARVWRMNFGGTFCFREKGPVGENKDMPKRTLSSRTGAIENAVFAICWALGSHENGGNNASPIDENADANCCMRHRRDRASNAQGFSVVRVCYNSSGTRRRPDVLLFSLEVACADNPIFDPRSLSRPRLQSLRLPWVRP